MMRALYLQWQRLKHEIAKFGVVGGLGYILDLGISNVAHAGMGLGWYIAKILSGVIAGLFTYVGNRFWSFRHRARTGARREFPMFSLLSGIGIGINEAILAFADHVLGLHGFIAFNLFGNVIGVGVATVFRFWAYKRFVFLHPEHPRAVSAAAAAATAPAPAQRAHTRPKAGSHAA